MIQKLILASLLLLSVFSQVTTQTTSNVQSSSPLSLARGPITSSGGYNAGYNSGYNSGYSSGSSTNQNDISESQATSLINSLFGNDSNAASSILGSSNPAPTNAPSGARLSSSAPTATMLASVGGSAQANYGGYVGSYGHWVRVLRCSYQNYGSGFCCQWVWVWKYW